MCSSSTCIVVSCCCWYYLIGEYNLFIFILESFNLLLHICNCRWMGLRLFLYLFFLLSKYQSDDSIPSVITHFNISWSDKLSTSVGLVWRTAAHLKQKQLLKLFTDGKLVYEVVKKKARKNLRAFIKQKPLHCSVSFYSTVLYTLRLHLW